MTSLMRTASVVLLALGLPTWATTYFISPSGGDNNGGKAPESAWKSLARINSTSLVSGDRILLQGGGTFQGSLRLEPEHGQSELKGLEVGSYGEGRARILSPKSTGIRVTDCEEVVIKNLIVQGDGSGENDGCGLYLHNTRTDRRLNGLHIDGVEVSGFGQHGILVTGKTFGYSNVRVERCSTHGNRKGGLEVAGRLPWDAKTYAHQDVTVSECRSYDNSGDPNFTSNHSGSGVVLYQVDGGRIEKCAAWNNGGSCPARSGGPVGIWTCASRKVTIEYCESFENRSQGLDGGGFDLDGGSEDCVLQYNYSHDNRGPGLMVYTYAYASHADSGNVVRFNVSVNDATKNDRYAGLWIRADGKPMANVNVYHNTVITDNVPAARIDLTGVELMLRNNIFVSSPEAIPLRLDGTNFSGLQLGANLYWRRGAPFHIQIGGTKVTSLSQLATQLARRPIEESTFGIFDDPGLPLNSLSRRGEPVLNLHTLLEFKPRKGHELFTQHLPAIRHEEVLRDFLGQQFPRDGRICFGAVED